MKYVGTFSSRETYFSGPKFDLLSFKGKSKNQVLKKFQAKLVTNKEEASFGIWRTKTN